MISKKLSNAASAIGISVLLCAALPAHAALIKWHVVGVISGEAGPASTTNNFPRPLAAGELVEMTYTIDTSATANIIGSYASYEGAIVSVKITGNDWTVNLRSQAMQRGAVMITDDNPDYGDSLELASNTYPSVTKTWYIVDTSFRNPGGPNPGPGPWQPFTSLTLPLSPPNIGYFPNTVFYLTANRGLPEQSVSSNSYYGQILSITRERCNER